MIASIWPSRRPSRLAVVDHVPFALVDDLQNHLVGARRRQLELHGLDIRIGDALLLGGIQARIHGRVGAFAGAQPRQGLEARRVDRIGGDVVDLRQLAVLQGEIGGIGQHCGVDEKREQDAAHAARAVLPDRSERAEPDQDRKSGHRKPADEGHHRRLDFEEIGSG